MLSLAPHQDRPGSMLRRRPDAAPSPRDRPWGDGFDAGQADERLATCIVQALDWLEPGIVLLDDRDRVLFASASARDLLRGGRGVTIAGDVLRVGSPSAAARLRHLIARCTSRAGESAGAPASCRVGDPALSISIVPTTASPGAAGSRSLAVLVVVDPQRSTLPSVQFLRDQFGLTSAQATLTLQVASGQGLQAAAKNLGIGVSTARSHLKQVFGKTGTTRQAELVRVVVQARHHVRGSSA